MAKFFFGAAVWGRLLLRDIPDRGSWDPTHIVYWDETYLDGISRLALIGQKIGAVAELDDAIAASRHAPGIRSLWIHEDLLADVQRRWEAPREIVKNRWRAPAAIAAAAAAAFLIGLMANGRGPEGQAPVPMPNKEAARVPATPPKPPASVLVKADAPRVVQSAVASYVSMAAPQTARLRPQVAFAVSVGTFASPAAADRMKHLVLSKGYVVVVVHRGALSQVVTPPYRTHAQAERVVHGLNGSGIPEQITTWRAP